MGLHTTWIELANRTIDGINNMAIPNVAWFDGEIGPQANTMTLHQQIEAQGANAIMIKARQYMTETMEYYGCICNNRRAAISTIDLYVYVSSDLALS